MIVRSCEACGVSNTEILLQNQVHHYIEDNTEETWIYNLVKCKNCGLVFIDPKPTWNILQTFYDTSYGCYHASINLPENEAASLKYRLASWRDPINSSINIKKMMAIGSEWLSGKTISYSLAVPLNLNKDAQIFEVGYGSGNWLRAMAQLGYHNLYGYDIDANSENVESLESAGINVTSGIFLDNEYPQEFFDCIRLEHVFEHLIEPQLVLEKCWHMLKPGGLLVMNFPVGNSISFKISVIHSSIRVSPMHLYLHTSESIQLLLKKAKFKNIRSKLYPVSLVGGATLNGVLAERNIKIPSKVFIALAPIYNVLGQLAKKGDHITLVASKL